jgi:Uma2 family endonuclease
MAQAAHHVFDFAAYVMLEHDSAVKHEYLRGQVWAMSGGTPAHARVAGNVLTLLSTQLRERKCSAFTSDLRIRVQATDLATYPDVSVVCGSLSLDPEDAKGHTVVNPRVVVEVLSPSTEAYDRGEKLAHYKQIPELAEIVLVAHDRREIQVVRREADGAWSAHVWRGNERARVESIGCELPLVDVYRDPLA